MLNKTDITKIKYIIKEAGKKSILLRNLNLKIFIKKDQSPVTNADLELDKFIAKNLSNLFPNIPIISEEQEQQSLKNDEYFWLIDPIDGTKGFINNQPYFTVNIALINKQKKPEFGFIYAPDFDSLYYVDENKNLSIEKNKDISILNNHKNTEFNNFTAITSFNNFNEKTKNYLQNKKIKKIIKMSSSLKFCLLAENLADIYPKFGPTMEWDTAAGDAILQAAGGKILNHNEQTMIYGKENFKNGDFFACNKKWLDFHISK